MQLTYLLFMIFLHICDDYYLQGWLASAKQKSWWEVNAPHEKYKRDYIIALFMHSFSWSFMVMLPILYYCDFKVNSMYLSLLLLNLMVHMMTDHTKANLKKINLVQDQLIHLGQIIVTYMLIFS